MQSRTFLARVAYASNLAVAALVGCSSSSSTRADDPVASGADVDAGRSQTAPGAGERPKSGGPTEIDAGAVDANATNDGGAGNGAANDGSSATPVEAAPPPAVITGTNLEELAKSMQSGQWAELVTNDINPTLTENGNSGVATGYADKMAWDPVTQQAFFIGSDHRDLQIFVSYTASTNTWQRLPRDTWMPKPTDYNNGMGHGYEHSTVDPASRSYLFHEVCATDVPIHRYDIDTQVWTGAAVPLPYTSSTAGCYIAVEYFPELGGVFLTDAGGAYLLQDNASAWTTLAPLGSLVMGGYQHVAHYNPIHKVIVFGGGDGSNQLYTLDGSSKITALKPGPVDIGVYTSVFTYDPLSGEYLVFTDDSKFYSYDVLSDTWTLKGSGAAVPIWNTSQYSPNAVFGVLATPISNFGVVMFVTTTGPNAFRVFLYKNA